MAEAGFLSRDAFLAYAGKLAEEVVHLEGMGDVICRELSGDARAKVLEPLSAALHEGGKADFGRYQELLLHLGLVDSASPEDDRKLLLDMATAGKAMKLGASKVEKLCSTIERLSGLDKKAKERAEGNSGADPSSTSTSE